MFPALRLARPDRRAHAAGMFVVSETDAAAIEKGQLLRETIASQKCRTIALTSSGRSTQEGE